MKVEVVILLALRIGKMSSSDLEKAMSKKLNGVINAPLLNDYTKL